jgi:hypothetical protein
MSEKKLLTINDQVAHLFPTPRANKIGGHSSKNFSPTLEQMVNLFPTPRAADGAKGQRTREGALKEANRGHGIDLPLFAQLYPTPTVHGDYNRKGVSANSGDGLATYVKKLYPTPTVNDAKNNAPPSQHVENGRHSNPLNVVAGGALNPTWVEWLMGFPLGWTEAGGSVNPISQESRRKVSLIECSA